MDLKELLGEELYSQVKDKAGDHKLAVVNDGNWFPKEKFDAVNTDNKELKQTIKERDEQLQDLSGKAQGNEDLQKQIEKLQEDNKQAAEAYQQKLDKQAFDFALEKAISGAEARNPKAVKALLDVDSIKLDGDKLLGLDEQLKGLKESDSYLFGGDDPKLKGREPNPDKQPPAAGGKNPFSKEHFNLTEQGRLLRDDPEKYNKLKAQA